MRLGITAYPTATGLGYQCLSYAKHLAPSKIMSIDITGFNGMPLQNWYTTAQKVVGYPTDENIRTFLKGLDVVLFAETPLNYNFYSIAREMGVKTACVVNWEFFDHIAKPELPLPDLFIMPSVWHLEDMQAFGAAHNVKVVQIHHPVDLDDMQFTQRASAKPMHITGRPAANDRNGTKAFLQACPNGVVTTQSDDMAWLLRKQYRHCNVITDIKRQRDVYNYGDILVLPRRYGGNCLPLNEALACGMPVIMPDISPNNYLLPKEWLVPASVVDTFVPRTKIDIFDTDVTALQDKINWFKTADMAAESQKALAIAKSISWETLKPKYIEELKAL